MADQTGGNSATAEAEPATNGQAAPAVSSGTSTQNGQATTQAQSAPAEEKFTSIDPKTLPPELQAVYKNLQADYTKKTMSVADKAKKADMYDKIVSRPDFKDYWNGMNRAQKADFKEQKAVVEKKLGERISDQEFAKSFETKEGYLALQEKIAQAVLEKSQSKLQELEQKLSVRDAQDVVNAYATELGADGKPMRPDFDSLDEDRLISGFLRVNPPEAMTAEAQRARVDEAYQWAKSVTQKYYEKGRQEALARIQEKAATSTERPTQSAKGAYTGPAPKNLTPREAMELAKKGIRVPRDD